MVSEKCSKIAVPSHEDVLKMYEGLLSTFIFKQLKESKNLEAFFISFSLQFDMAKKHSSTGKL